jgi:hypothetical protein
MLIPFLSPHWGMNRTALAIMVSQVERLFLLTPGKNPNKDLVGISS